MMRRFRQRTLRTTKPHLISVLGLVCLLGFVPATGLAQRMALPDDPGQSITYWKQHAIAAEKDKHVALAHDVFNVLLRGWDNSRLEPGLYVVRSDSGPWAASLADGNILLSRAAIDTCLKFGQSRARHLLAFVLAHELAHQRSDDLWHQRFFRLIGNQGPEYQRRLMTTLQKDQQAWQDISEKEVQADHDALILMASVGYDPYQVIDKKDFFTSWVESIWQASCQKTGKGISNTQACLQAKQRTLRAHARLATVATQATLYDMGVQSFIAGDYTEARRYFTAYGRDYTNRAVLTALGLSYFAEARQLYQHLHANYKLDKPALYFPLLLDANASIQKAGVNTEGKRAAIKLHIKRQQQKISRLINKSTEYYEKAIRLEPDHAQAWLLQAFAYLLDNNTYMARGLIQGKYIHRFGHDVVADLVLAMTKALEGDGAATEQAFKALRARLEAPDVKSALPLEVLIYTAYFNSAVYANYRNKPERAKRYWQTLARQAQKNRQTLLFRLAVGQVTGSPLRQTDNRTTNAYTIHGINIGDRFQRSGLSSKQYRHEDIWIEGEKYRVIYAHDGSRFVTDKRDRVMHSWQADGTVRLGKAIQIGEPASRVFKSLGLPTRQINMLSGDYLIYDQHGLAVHVLKQHITGWFLYQRPQNK